MKRSPDFQPGDLVEIIGIAYPPKSGKVSKWMGLYDEPGFPNLIVVNDKNAPRNSVVEALNEHIVSSIINGEQAIVIAVVYHTDERWYYLLNAENRRRMGWSRTSVRMKKLV